MNGCVSGCDKQGLCMNKEQITTQKTKGKYSGMGVQLSWGFDGLYRIYIKVWVECVDCVCECVYVFVMMMCDTTMCQHRGSVNE